MERRRIGFMTHLSKAPRAKPDIATKKPEAGSPIVFALLSLLVGTVSGLVCALFRLSLEKADQMRNALIVWAHAWPIGGLCLVVAVCAGATAFAVWLVRRYSPYASGSGIPRVEAVLRDELPPAPPILILVKFLGGWVAMGAGLVLGREGPSVQIGASLGQLVGKVFSLSGLEQRALLAAGAGAGLAAAFNAPIAGAVFVLEELARRFDTSMTIATFGASAGAIAVTRLLLGQSPVFHVGTIGYAGFGALPIFLVLGLVVGILGTLYNITILRVLSAVGRLNRWPVELRAAVIGAGVGLLGWFAPRFVGGGDPLTQEALDANTSMSMLPWLFVLRFGLGPISYAAATPGGLFAPILVLGAQSGLLFGTACLRWLPSATVDAGAFAVTAMAAFFTAVVRAPVTGIALVLELTGIHTQLLPMLAACFAAMLVPTVLHVAPIYDALKPSGYNRTTFEQFQS
jgi:chloride channel protein, CIC family